jgi:anti-sigma factor RsiW
MSCASVQARLSALIDGDLDDIEAASLREHIVLCEACRRAERDLRRVADEMSRLPVADPPEHLWRRIEAALEAPSEEESRGSLSARVHRRWRRLALVPVGLAAAAGLALVVTWRSGPSGRPAHEGRSAALGGLLVVGSPAEELDMESSERLPDHLLLEEAEREFRAAEVHYVRAAERLAALVERERRTRPFSPDLAAAFDRNLKVIDEAIARCRELARGARGDPWVQEVLYAAYTRKLRFLEDILWSRVVEVAVP